MCCCLTAAARATARASPTPAAGAATDIKAAIAYLQRRPDVDPDRIGGIGLSVGGEMMLETAAETDQLAAVVSEGAGARTYSEDMDQDDRRRSARLPIPAIKTASITVFSNQTPPAEPQGSRRQDPRGRCC